MLVCLLLSLLLLLLWLLLWLLFCVCWRQCKCGCARRINEPAVVLLLVCVRVCMCVLVRACVRLFGCLLVCLFVCCCRCCCCCCGCCCVRLAAPKSGMLRRCYLLSPCVLRGLMPGSRPWVRMRPGRASRLRVVNWRLGYLCNSSLEPDHVRKHRNITAVHQPFNGSRVHSTRRLMGGSMSGFGVEALYFAGGRHRRRRHL